MDLCDGLREYQKCIDWDFTLWLEALAEEILAMLSEHGAEPTENCLPKAKEFLIGVEQWKAMCIQDQTGWAATNPTQEIWRALHSAVYAERDIESLLSIMSLRGFGQSQDPETGQRRAKRATAVLRFLKPHDWGVVDWRTVAVLGLLRRNDGDVDRAFAQARGENAGELRKLYDIIEEQGACETNHDYRAMRTVSLSRLYWAMCSRLV